MSCAEIAVVAEFGDRRGEAENSEATKVLEYAVFDVLRFALAFAVLLSHMGALRWAHAGNLAVEVFFALSGWLIGSILCRTSPAELSRFYFNRATRIWIPYFVTVCALYLVSFLHEQSLSSRWHEFLLYDLTFTHNWFSLLPNALAALNQMPLHGTGNHFWSIAVEEQFYLAAPLVITLLPLGRSVYIWITIAAAAILTGGFYGSIALGVLCAVVAQNSGSWHLSPLGRIALVAVLISASCSMAFDGHAYVYAAPFFSAALVLLCAIPMRRTAASHWLGGISYPLYLNAWVGVFALHALVKRLGIPEAGWLYEVSVASSAVLGAVAFYHLIDRVVISNRNGYYRRSLGWVLGGFSYALLLIGIIYGRHEISARQREVMRGVSPIGNTTGAVP